MQTPLRAYHPRKNVKQTAPARIMPGGATCFDEPFLIRKWREKEATSACLRAKQLSVDSRSSKKKPCCAAGRLALRRTSIFTRAPPCFLQRCKDYTRSRVIPSASLARF